MALAISALKYNYVSIQSPTSGKKAIDLSNHLIHTEYFEDLLSPVITMKMRIRSEFNYVAKVPIRGGELVAFSAQVGGTTIQFGEIDSNGYLSITGRMKEIYVSSSGKNVAPLVIEETMKSIPLVSQCFLVGDGRKFCSALLTLDMGIILRDKLSVDPNDIPKDPIKQNQMIIDKGSSLSAFTDNVELFNEIK